MRTNDFDAIREAVMEEGGAAKDRQARRDLWTFGVWFAVACFCLGFAAAG